jgi:hypothetical protein
MEKCIVGEKLVGEPALLTNHVQLIYRSFII